MPHLLGPQLGLLRLPHQGGRVKVQVFDDGLQFLPVHLLLRFLLEEGGEHERLDDLPLELLSNVLEGLLVDVLEVHGPLLEEVVDVRSIVFDEFTVEAVFFGGCVMQDDDLVAVLDVLDLLQRHHHDLSLLLLQPQQVLHAGGELGV